MGIGRVVGWVDLGCWGAEEGEGFFVWVREEGGRGRLVAGCEGTSTSSST